MFSKLQKASYLFARKYDAFYLGCNKRYVLDIMQASNDVASPTTELRPSDGR